MNQLYNKRVAKRKVGKPQAYWDSFLSKLTRKRNHQMRDMGHRANQQFVQMPDRPRAERFAVRTLVL